MPRQPVPDLSVPTLDGPTWTLSEQAPENFTLIVFYRGLHCPICSGYIRDLDRKESKFNEKGVEVLAVSSDSEDRARQTKESWDLPNLTIGHSLPIETAREWGLYISTSRGVTSVGIEEPALFSEPGLYLVRPDRTLYAGAVNTMPFARTNFGELLKALDFIIEKDYPARGEA
jgi:peroxiredoxin